MMSIPEAAAYFLGYRYATISNLNRLPVVRDCLPGGLIWEPGDAKLIDCSTFVTAVLVYAHADRVKWDQFAYADMQVMNADRLWSCVDAWERHGLGVPAAMTQGWGAYQGWVDDQPAESDGDPISGGHQWLYHGGMGVRLHSSSRGSVGPVWERVDWSDLVARYRSGIRGVALSSLR